MSGANHNLNSHNSSNNNSFSNNAYSNNSSNGSNFNVNNKYSHHSMGAASMTNSSLDPSRIQNSSYGNRTPHNHNRNYYYNRSNAFHSTPRLVPLDPPIDAVHVYGGYTNLAVRMLLSSLSRTNNGRNNLKYSKNHNSGLVNNKGSTNQGYSANNSSYPDANISTATAQSSSSIATTGSGKAVIGGGPLSVNQRGGKQMDSGGWDGGAVYVASLIGAPVKQILIHAASIAVIRQEEERLLMIRE
eukprot:CAMPEP_0175046866 /NCGR_PEP_ID=MMETSP0052_2-20121109/5270_1 /TAXON_ID=51329 ORGANISM="Polytomella parva, Strain SAG 63-3" /NCGR_SAMPLE_ID=MMETSP0052_2 /ASSEMBLY_ACC=CAM_ASM_000194 /LENGTH=243 /DNA_ID=CAMNT_0016310663 /DNA_START=10 /DNA_END=738 /DNA_ORIENTATION=+